MIRLHRTMAALALPLALGAGGGAWAHAFLERATPRVGGTVQSAPDRVTLRFTEPLEAAFSSVKVLDANGQQVDRGDKAVDKSDRRVLHVSVPQLAAGKYRVTWRAVSVDTHVTEGDFTFEVRP
ncbi:MAG TPA: copper homeostasis periplasmic binding protein CopC [Usitatibacter sp.]|nr:copper homeostasis periplasmic binding protein CopC [Usitatibacter sp.]